MSHKLKIMQVPLTRRAAQAIDEETVIYKFGTCGFKNYFVEVAAGRGLTGAIDKLAEHFALDVNQYCEQCESPLFNKMELVDLDDVPQADNVTTFVALMYGEHLLKEEIVKAI